MTPEEKTPIARYECESDNFSLISYMSTSPHGRWCKWDDVSPLIDRIAALEGAIRVHRDNITHPHADDQTLWSALD